MNINHVGIYIELSFLLDSFHLHTVVSMSVLQHEKKRIKYTVLTLWAFFSTQKIQVEYLSVEAICFKFFFVFQILEYGISATLCTLLSWLLSLTPNSMEKVSNEAQYPFFVIGLQRLFIDGQLSIFVAVKPADMSFINSLSAKSKRGKVSNFV